MKLIKRGLLMLAVLVGLGLTGSQAAWAKAKLSQVDPTTIAPCTSATTTLALSNVVYTLTTSFSTTFTGTCIKVTGNNDLIIIGPEVTITGPGLGIGIDVEGSNVLINGRSSFITGFATGVVDNGTDTLGDNLNFSGNGVGLKMTGHTVKWSNMNSSSNTSHGIWINGCSDTCTVEDFFVGSNGGDGVLINGASQGPVLSVFISQDNTGDGVHVGAATGNAVGNAFIDDASLAESLAINNNGGDGVVLDVSEASAIDMVTGVISDMNGGIDMHDATANCGSTGHFNLWSSNSFGTSKAGTTSSPVCIPDLPTL
jgi:hypothetical protein